MAYSYFPRFFGRPTRYLSIMIEKDGVCLSGACRARHLRVI